MPRSNRRRALAMTLALAWPAVTAMAADAPPFPSRPITIVVGSSPGSTTDGLARQIAQEITVQTRVPVIVDNRAGANGGIAAHSSPSRRPTATPSS